MKKYYKNLELIETDWGNQQSKDWLGKAKFQAFKCLDTDLKLILDIDEFFNDMSVGDLMKLDRNKIYAGEYVHFVGSWKSIGQAEYWPRQQWRLGFRTDPAIYHHFTIDASGSNLEGVEPDPVQIGRAHV